MRKILIVFSMLLISSCDHFEEDKKVATEQLKADSKQAEENIGKSVTRMASNVRDSIKRTNNKLREWWLTPLPPEPEKHLVSTRYCYKVLQDILCYREQMPGWEGKLVGYQGHNAQPPAQVVTKLIPLRPDNPNSLPEVRAANAKPVFATMPESKDAKDPNSGQAPVTIDATHENLPDSTLSPQL